MVSDRHEARGAGPSTAGRSQSVDNRDTAQPGGGEPLAIAAPEHGGTLAAVSRAYPDAPRPWIDLSTGINPLPWPWPRPLPPVPPEALTRLPEPGAITALEQRAAHAYGARDPSSVVAAPGTQILIGLLPRLQPARRVAIVGPTYSEHAVAWRGAGAAVEIVGNPAAGTGADVVVVVNPNNPDGRITAPDRLHAIARHLAETDGLLVVDETFADLAHPSPSCVSTLPTSGMVVLRSFGKTYGLPGVRLGFAVADRRMADLIRRALGPWAVAGPAVVLGTNALGDASWREAAGRRLDAAVARLDAAMSAAGLRVLGGTRLFRLGVGPEAPAIFDRLARAGIVVRRFGDQPEQLRFGLPGGATAWQRLEAALRC